MPTSHAIVETLCGQFFRVWETEEGGLSHVWHGVAVKRTKSGFVDKAKAREILVRKVGTRVVAMGA